MSSADGTPTCEPTDGGPSAAKANGNWWEDKQAEADNDEEPNRDNDENNPPLLRPTMNRCRSTTCEESSRKRGIKRCRLSSPLPSDEETEICEESDCSNYTPETHNILKSRPVSSHSTGLEGDTSNVGKTEFAVGRSRMAVIYE